jgi:hypothetical protein
MPEIMAFMDASDAHRRRQTQIHKS